MSEGLQATNVKIITKSSVSGTETLEHKPVRSETFYPKSGRIEKEKV
jgi:hypothetical protein